MVRIIAGAAFIFYAAVTGCGNGDGDAASSSVQAPAATDTASAGAYDGLSRKQLDRRAEPITPQQAEQIGIPTLDPDSTVPSSP